MSMVEMPSSKPFLDSTPLLGDAAALQARASESGYLFFRGLLPGGDVRKVANAVLHEAWSSGWFESARPTMGDVIPAGPGMLTLLGLTSWPSALWVLPLAVVAGVMFSALGLVITAITKNISSFNLPMFLCIMPMFMFSGTFFPVSILPKWALWIAWCLPLTHVSYLVRAAVLGMGRGHLVWSALYVLVLSVAMAGLALKLMKRRLIQ